MTFLSLVFSEEIKKTIDTLTKKIEEDKALIKKLTEELRKPHDSNQDKDLHDQIDKLEKQVKETKKTVIIHKTIVKVITIHNEEKKRPDSTQHDTYTDKKTIKELKKTLEDVRKTIEKLEKKIERHEETIRKLTEELKKPHDQSTQKSIQDKIDRLTKEIRETKETIYLQKRIEVVITKEITIRERELKEDKDHPERPSEKTNDKKVIEEQKKTLEEIKKTIDTLTKKIEEDKALIKKLTEELRKPHDSNQDKDLHDQIDKLEKQVKETKKTVIIHKTIVKVITIHNEEKKRPDSTQHDTYTDKKTIKELKKTLEDVRKTIEKLEKKIERHEETIRKLTEELKKPHDQSTQKSIQDKIDRLTKEIRETKETIYLQKRIEVVITKEITIRERELKEDKDHPERPSEKTNDKKVIEEQKKTLEEIKKTIDTLTKKIEEDKALIKKLTEELRKPHDSNQDKDLHDQIDKLEKQVKETKKTVIIHKTIVKVITIHNEEKKRPDSTQHDTYTDKKTIKELKKTLEDVRKTIEKLEKKIERHEETIRKLTEELKKPHDQSTQKSIQDKIDRLTKEIRETKETIYLQKRIEVVITKEITIRERELKEDKDHPERPSEKTNDKKVIEEQKKTLEEIKKTIDTLTKKIEEDKALIKKLTEELRKPHDSNQDKDLHDQIDKLEKQVKETKKTVIIHKTIVKVITIHNEEKKRPDSTQHDTYTDKKTIKELKKTLEDVRKTIEKLEKKIERHEETIRKLTEELKKPHDQSTQKSIQDKIDRLTKEIRETKETIYLQKRIEVVITKEITIRERELKEDKDHPERPSEKTNDKKVIEEQKKTLEEIKKTIDTLTKKIEEDKALIKKLTEELRKPHDSNQDKDLHDQIDKLEKQVKETKKTVIIHKTIVKVITIHNEEKKRPDSTQHDTYTDKKTIKELKKTLEDVRKTIEKLEKKIERHEETIRKLTEELKKPHDQSTQKSIQDKIDRLTKEIRETKETIYLQKRIEVVITKEITIRERELKEDKDHPERPSEKTNDKKVIEEQKKTLEEIKKTIDTLTKKIEEDKALIKKLTEELRKPHDSNQDKDLHDQIDKLEKQVKETKKTVIIHKTIVKVITIHNEEKKRPDSTQHDTYTDKKTIKELKKTLEDVRKTIEKLEKKIERHEETIRKLTEELKKPHDQSTQKSIQDKIDRLTKEIRETKETIYLQKRIEVVITKEITIRERELKEDKDHPERPSEKTNDKKVIEEQKKTLEEIKKTIDTLTKKIEEDKALIKKLTEELRKPHDSNQDKDLHDQIDKLEKQVKETKKTVIIHKTIVKVITIHNEEKKRPDSTQHDTYTDKKTIKELKKTLEDVRKTIEKLEKKIERHEETIRKLTEELKKPHDQSTQKSIQDKIDRLTKEIRETKETIYLQKRIEVVITKEITIRERELKEDKDHPERPSEKTNDKKVIEEQKKTLEEIKKTIDTLTKKIEEDKALIKKLTEELRKPHDSNQDKDLHDQIDKLEKQVKETKKTVIIHKTIVKVITIHNEEKKRPDSTQHDTYTDKKTIKELKKTLEDVRKTIEKLEKKIERHEETIRKLTEELKKPHDQSTQKSIQDKIDRLTKEIRETKETIYLQKRIEVVITKEITIRERELKEDKDHPERPSEKTNDKKVIEEQKKTLEEIKKTIDTLTKKIEEDKALIKKLTEELRKPHDSNQDKDLHDQIDKLEKQVKETKKTVIIHKTIVKVITIHNEEKKRPDSTQHDTYTDKKTIKELKKTLEDVRKTIEKLEKKIERHEETIRKLTEELKKPHDQSTQKSIQDKIDRLTKEIRETKETIYLQKRIEVVITKEITIRERELKEDKDHPERPSEKTNDKNCSSMTFLSLVFSEGLSG